MNVKLQFRRGQKGWDIKLVTDQDEISDTVEKLAGPRYTNYTENELVAHVVSHIFSKLGYGGMRFGVIVYPAITRKLVSDMAWGMARDIASAVIKMRGEESHHSYESDYD